MRSNIFGNSSALLYLRSRKSEIMKIVSTPHTITQPVVATIGMFDGVHTGHLSLIAQVQQEAAQMGMASAIVTFASHPRNVLRPQSPIPLLTTYHERNNLLARTGVDYAITLDFTPQMAQLSAYDFIALLHDNYNIRGLYIGYDHRFGHNRSEGFSDYCTHGEKIGVKVIEALPYATTSGIASSSAIRKALQTSDITLANTLLGYNYRLSGTVVSGKQLGRQIGFPTANISPNHPNKLIPAAGAYAVRARLADGSIRQGMMNIGTRPTVNSEENVSLEVHLFDYSGDLYGQTLDIEFVAFMRKEMQFPSLQALQQALRSDAATARHILSQNDNTTL